jgi:glycosyltransferase involved in cell wall biosynthesis
VAPGRVVVVQTVIPDYRRPFFEALAAAIGPRFELLSGSEDWELDVAHSDDFPHTRVRNVFLAGRRLLWQAGVVRRVLGAEVAVLSLNPRITTNWIALIVRRVLGRRTLLWGHAWSRSGETSRTERVRAAMRRVASGVIVYTESEAARLRSLSPDLDVVAAPNALYGRRELPPATTTGHPTDLLCVGRLTPSKKPALVLEAFAAALPSVPEDVRLVFVGDGQLRSAIETSIRSADLDDRVVLTGHVSSPASLNELYARAIASVAGGYVGLALTQTLSFGVPMILPRHASHAPEVEAAQEGVNVIFVEGPGPSSLSDAMVAVAARREEWLSRRDEIATPIRERYSIERMVESFVGALRVTQTAGGATDTTAAG